MACGTHNYGLGRSSHWKNSPWFRPFQIGILAPLLTGGMMTIQGSYDGIAQAQTANVRDWLGERTSDIGSNDIPTDGSRLWKRFFDTDAPEPPRDGSRGFGFCVIEPNGYEGIVWSDRPSLVFESQGTDSEIALFRSGDLDPLWTQSLTAANQVSWIDRVDEDGNDILVYHVTYNGTTSLSASDDYIWKITSLVSGTASSPIWISVLPEGEQGAIAQELASLETTWRQEGLDEEAIALEQADYFAAQGLWDDFWHEVMSIERPSEDLQELMESILSTLCP